MIDKDIEIVKEFKEKGFASLMIKYNKNRTQTNTMVETAIENVLADRETWKKTAEKLAEDKIIPKCKNCSDEDTHECTECALDWARKEVEKDVKD